MCKENGCKIKPVFNKEGEKNGLYCVTHKKDGMVNVKSKTCLECKNIPFFNKFDFDKRYNILKNARMLILFMMI